MRCTLLALGLPLFANSAIGEEKAPLTPEQAADAVFEAVAAGDAAALSEQAGYVPGVAGEPRNQDR